MPNWCNFFEAKAELAVFWAASGRYSWPESTHVMVTGPSWWNYSSGGSGLLQSYHSTRLCQFLCTELSPATASQALDPACSATRHRPLASESGQLFSSTNFGDPCQTLALPTGLVTLPWEVFRYPTGDGLPMPTGCLSILYSKLRLTLSGFLCPEWSHTKSRSPLADA